MSKILLSSGGEERQEKSGPDMTARQMIDKVKTLADGLHYDVVSIGYPGPVHHNKPLIEPANLGKGWVGCDFAASFGKPTKVVNDALMQAIGSYEGGRMLFLGLGTGLGAAMIVENVAQPMELAHLPYKKGRSFEDYVGERGLEKRGLEKWRKSVFDVVEPIASGDGARLRGHRRRQCREARRVASRLSARRQSTRVRGRVSALAKQSAQVLTLPSAACQLRMPASAVRRQRCSFKPTKTLLVL